MDVYGSTFPGGFCVFHGGNENLGWAHTVIGADVNDVYRLRTHPQNKNLYWYDNQWRAFDTREVALRVKVGPAHITVRKETLWSVHGPCLRNRDGVYAIRTGLLAEVRAGEQWYRLNKVKNFSEFQSVFQHYNAFQGLNVVYADREGNIYSAANVLIPTGRDAAHDWRQIQPGHLPELVWPFQFYPHSELPQVLNPSSGFVFNTNNTVMCPTDTALALDISRYPECQWGWDRTNNNRASRLLELMAQRTQPLTWEEFKRIKYDQSLPRNSRFMAQMKPLFEVDTTRYPDVAGLVHTLGTWDRSFSPESEGAAVFSIAIYELWKEEKGGGLRFFQEGFAVSPERAVRTLRKVQARFRKHFHRQRILLGEMLRHRRGRVDLPAGGFADVLGALVGEPGRDGRFRATVGDSFVMLMDFGSEETRVEAIHAYGASSNPSSPHYTDQMELFLKHQTRPVRLSMDWHREHAQSQYHPQ
jgi:acyl-homoserine-lactone acylase